MFTNSDHEMTRGGERVEVRRVQQGPSPGVPLRRPLRAPAGRLMRLGGAILGAGVVAIVMLVLLQIAIWLVPIGAALLLAGWIGRSIRTWRR